MLRWGAGGIALASLGATTAVATLADVTGRTIRIETPIRRVLLGEGRQIFIVGALDRDNPFGRVVGWRDDLIKSEPDSWRQYRRLDPAAARLPLFNGMHDGAIDVERAIDLRPDVILLNVESVGMADQRFIEILDAVGIRVAFIDFRTKPFRNTDPSIRLLGSLFGREHVAEQLIAFRAAQVARVTDRLATAGDLRRPLVMLDRIPGYMDECCPSFGTENFGRIVEVAGGRNLGAKFIPKTFGTLDPETVLTADPDVVIATGGDFRAAQPGGGWVGLGPGANLEKAKGKLEALMKRAAFAGTKAARDGRVHAIWHQFYNNPYQFVAIQRIAKWLHPQLFADLDPEATFRELHERFLPVPYEPGYWVSLERPA